MAHIERGAHASRDRVRNVRDYLKTPHGGDETAYRVRPAFHRADPFGRPGERVVAKVHGRGAGVICLAFKDDLIAALADDRVDDSERQRERFEHRSLLDVKLDI